MTSKGRARRKEFWYFILVNFTISVGLGFVSGIVGILLNTHHVDSISNLYALAVFVPSIAVFVRRMHDVDKSGWYCLVPIYNFILLIRDGSKGSNQYGPDPKPIDDHFGNSVTAGGEAIENSGSNLKKFAMALIIFLAIVFLLQLAFLSFYKSSKSGEQVVLNKLELTLSASHELTPENKMQLKASWEQLLEEPASQAPFSHSLTIRKNLVSLMRLYITDKSISLSEFNDWMEWFNSRKTVDTSTFTNHLVKSGLAVYTSRKRNN